MLKLFATIIIIMMLSFLSADTMTIYLNNGDSYGFVLEDVIEITFDNATGIEIAEFLSKLPIDFIKNYPNPFNPATTISFELNQAQMVSVSIYNIKGQLVRELADDLLESGNHKILWDGKDDNRKPVASGTYFYRVKTETGETIKKMLLLK